MELHLPEERTKQAIDHLLQERQLKDRDSVHLTGGNRSLLSRPRFYFAEQCIAENLFRLLESPPLTNFGPSVELLDACQERLDLRLAGGLQLFEAVARDEPRLAVDDEMGRACECDEQKHLQHS